MAVAPVLMLLGEVMQCCRTEVTLVVVVFVGTKITPGFAVCCFSGVLWVQRAGAMPWLCVEMSGHLLKLLAYCPFF